MRVKLVCQQEARGVVPDEGGSMSRMCDVIMAVHSVNRCTGRKVTCEGLGKGQVCRILEVGGL